MIKRYECKSELPYLMSDVKISKIIYKNDDLKLVTKNGFTNVTPPFAQVKGNVIIERTVSEVCFIYLLSKNGKAKKFHGRKMLLEDFLSKYNKFEFEIVDECYGFKQVIFSGYVSLPGKDELIQMILSIIFNGDIVYESESKEKNAENAEKEN